MNISYNWLKKYINTDVAPEELAKILTSIGLETGSTEKVQSVKGGLEGLVVGHVLTCVPHENSDHLHVTTVNIGQGEPLQIVCGAPNVAAGQKVIVATIGTVLYDGDESFTIKRSKIRGVESFGMICAEDEIGVGTSHDGIMVLPDDTPVGMPAKEYFHVEDDTLIEVDITPNRVDAASHYGVARDLAAWCALNAPEVKLTKPSVEGFRIDNNKLPVPVEVRNPEACPRYSGLTIRGVHVQESPEWLQNALRTIGLRPINNVVDVTNYVLHEMGQPLHAFDVAKIKGGKIIVGNVPQGTEFVTLDGVTRKLDAADLMICNAEEPMCIAGVFGGLDSGVTESTTDVFLESAYFNPVSIRKTARRHGLNTDASFRYERGCDPNNTLYILKRCAMLVQEVAGGQISSDIVDVKSADFPPFRVEFSLQNCRNLIGKHLERQTVETILAALEIGMERVDDDKYILQVPTYRVDVQRECDVIEDILRIYGYNNVELSNTLHSNLSFAQKPESHRVQTKLSEQLTACGFNEILNNSLTKTGYYDNGQTYKAENCVKVMNPLSKDLGVMRQTLLFGGLETIAHNANRKNADLKLYEFGNCYYYHAERRDPEKTLAAYSEAYHLALWITGNKTAQTWVRPEEKSTFFELKAYVENLFRRLGIDPESLHTEPAANELFAEGVNLYSRRKRLLGFIGIVSPSTRKDFDIDNDVFYAELEWQALLDEYKDARTRYTELPRFPEVKRDMALLIDQSVKFGDLQQAAFQAERKLLKHVNLFDVYEGKHIEAGKKSYAISFILQDTQKTLTDKQIDAIMDKLRKTFEDKFGATLR